MDIKELVAEYGVQNLRFFIPMHPHEMAGIIPGIAFKSSNSPEDMVECHIFEDRYKVAEGYKVSLAACGGENLMRYGREHFYQSDFNALLRDSTVHHKDRYRVYVIDIDGYTRIPIRWR
jgi:hypothetical protein